MPSSNTKSYNRNGFFWPAVGFHNLAAAVRLRGSCDSTGMIVASLTACVFLIDKAKIMCVKLIFLKVWTGLGFGWGHSRQDLTAVTV